MAPTGTGESWEWVSGLNSGTNVLPTAGVGGDKTRRALNQKEQSTEKARSGHLCTEITLYAALNSLAGSKCGYTDCCFLSEFKRLGLWQSFAKKSSIQHFIWHFLSWARVGGMVGLEVLIINTYTCFPEGCVQSGKQIHAHRAEAFLLRMFAEQLLGARAQRLRRVRHSSCP